MVWFRTRLTLLQEEISQKKRKNGKDKLKSKMVNVTISFSEMFGKKFCWRNTRWETAESPWVRIPPYQQMCRLLEKVWDGHNSGFGFNIELRR